MHLHTPFRHFKPQTPFNKYTKISSKTQCDVENTVSKRGLTSSNVSGHLLPTILPKHTYVPTV